MDQGYTPAAPGSVRMVAIFSIVEDNRKCMVKGSAMEKPVSTRTALLLALSQGPAYGLEIIGRVREAAGVELEEGSVYPTLDSMRREGLLRTWKANAAGGRGRPRSYFELTPAGSDEAMRYRSMLSRLLGAGAPKAAPSRREVRAMGARLREFLQPNDGAKVRRPGGRR
jgi:PadR family transcriptional regulator PadR